ncbi:MAG: hypothetical protein ACRD3G_21130 [Vicinamibacterales bacterium]
MRIHALATVMVGVVVGTLSTSAHRNESGSDDARSLRADAIARAQVWTPTDIPAVDIRTGPGGRRAFAFRETVTCDYVDKDLAGRSPKFACASAGDDLKVKFGGDNAEVYAEVAATRLLWALGFGADRMYPVRVICRSCPEVLPGVLRSDGSKLFDPAAIERKMPGKEFKPDSRWAWVELDQVQEARGGAPAAHRDALKLLAVFVQHTDSKPEQQRIVCREDDARTATTCTQPFMMINDVGLTFGGTSLANANSKAMNLAAWAASPIWKNESGCVGNLSRSATGTLKDPVIGEPGRAFLATLLTQLSDDQIAAVFEVSRVTLRLRNPEDVRSRFATVAEWVSVFKRKRAEIVDKRCG